jgi:hypothetical protein
MISILDLGPCGYKPQVKSGFKPCSERANMKDLYKAIIVMTSCFMLIACGQQAPVTPLPILEPATTETAPSMPLSSLTETTVLEPIAGAGAIAPTPLPGLDPAQVPEQLREAISIQSITGIGPREGKQLSGWAYGFASNASERCDGYYWLDNNHLLLYPRTGQIMQSIDGESKVVDVVSQPVVLNLDRGTVWLPPVNAQSSQPCTGVYWSSDLALLITSESQNNIATVSIYTYEGYRLSSYPGSIQQVSPSGTRILIADDTLIDLRTNKVIKLEWGRAGDQEQTFSNVHWTSTETRLYRCCYFYADLETGTSHRFEETSFRDAEGNPLVYSGLQPSQGRWVRNNTFFLTQWSREEDGDIRYLPMFDPATKVLYDVRKMAGIPEDWSSYQTSVSPDGTYLWIAGEEGSYLVTLFTFATQYFPGREYFDIDWSPNSRFAWLQNASDQTTQYHILSAADKVLMPLPRPPAPNSDLHWWHPVDSIVAYPTEENRLLLLDTSTMVYRELPFALEEPVHETSLVWSPDGQKLVFMAGNGSMWKMDYPTLGNLEQLTFPGPTIRTLRWSPDGTTITFIRNSDIYIVDAGN